VSGHLFSAFCLANSDPGRAPGPRVGFTTPRALGNAVVRNRIRRRTREAIRPRLAEIGPQWDIVINPRRAALEAPFAAMEAEVERLVRRCKP
jgi:ribonuclease P protein component